MAFLIAKVPDLQAVVLGAPAPVLLQGTLDALDLSVAFVKSPVTR